MTADKINYLKITVPETAEGERIGKYVLRNYREAVRSKVMLHRAFKRKEISVNGVPAEETRLLKTNDIIEVRYDTSVEEETKMKAIPIRICYEDDYLAVVWKPSGQNFNIFEKAIHFNTALKDSNGDRQKVWCINDIQKAASGLILVAKTQSVKDVLIEQYKNDEIQVTMRVLCHGFISTTDTLQLFLPELKNKKDEEAEEIEANDVLKKIDIISHTPSNNAQYISRLNLQLHTPLSSVRLRKLFFYHSKHPIIGNSKFTLPLKASDKGLSASLIKLSFIHPIKQTLIQIEEEEPAKFKALCDREARFYQNKLDREAEEIRKSGLSDIDSLERKEGQLLAYVLGQKEFWKKMFKVTKDCLIPRASSETLVRAAVTVLSSQQNAKRIIDVGTGCGNILISILNEIPSAIGVGIDISSAALEVAKENSRNLLSDNHRVEWRIQDMSTLDRNNEFFDVLVCNPPYLDYTKANRRRDQRALFEQEPAEALFAKDNGYEWYRVLSNVASHVVQPDGFVILECGKGMMEYVIDIWANDWEKDSSYKDYQGWDRCLVLRRKKNCT
ncbi:S-adenosyl-L-methionine-dependent methyltransferase [Cokeromyces recurvatus]|uniref:S-adenosyl-L-methionine-dependent methyltransferase n=1 Tax=Cokeromyces recurvatus TaxID=90255 RepID=UPI002220610D|nr:S-adenosyl-L-methionine-dependent methyltransferase [Cokeromyces recurvatus]KAI7906805.1 S-adenosyl-L-methionine-dependent methyltransferase [Cokeromyces recurvatus]